MRFEHLQGSESAGEGGWGWGYFRCQNETSIGEVSGTNSLALSFLHFTHTVLGARSRDSNKCMGNMSNHALSTLAIPRGEPSLVSVSQS